MAVLCSTRAFSDKYARTAVDFLGGVKMFIGGIATSGGAVATAVGTTTVVTTTTSVFAPFTTWPFIGAFAAGKVAAAGAAAAAAATSIALLPALALGAGASYLIYRGLKKKSLHKGSNIEDLADDVAHIAWLPMLSRASELCRENQTQKAATLAHVQNVMRDWGYAEAYTKRLFEDALESSASELDERFCSKMKALKDKQEGGFKVSLRELPRGFMQKLSEDFKSQFESCIHE